MNTGLKALWILSLLQVVAFQMGHGAAVDKNGGYSLTLAINGEEAEPENPGAYIENIKDTIGLLSTSMWKATHERFFIKDVEVILPSHWTGSYDLTVNSYKKADIRISTKVDAPSVENPNPCGLAGDYIELPLKFFETVRAGDYGQHWKVLLVSWARYRWGVNEEYGTPNDSRFPYFIRDRSNAAKPLWVANGCTNTQTPLKGEYRRIDNNAACDPASADALDVNCRFFPDLKANDDVKSSLMNYHFLDSVEQFCDKTTHNHKIPTKQNLFCDNKSVMEVIESTVDFTAVTEPLTDGLPLVNFNVVKAPVKPSLLVILDRGLKDNTDAGILNVIVTQLAKTLVADETVLPEDLVIGFGQYPTSATDSNLLLDLPFGLLKDRREELLDKLGNRVIVNNDKQDVGLAIQQAVAALEAESPTAGGNILLIKSVPATNSASYTLERETKVLLQENNIKLFAIEVRAGVRSRANLVNLAMESKGRELAIDDVGLSVPLTVETYLKQVAVDIADPPSHDPTLERITSGRAVEPTKTYKIPALMGAETVTFHLVSDEKLDVKTIVAGVKTDAVDIFAQFSESIEYSQETTAETNRFAYTGSIDTKTMRLREVSFQFQGTRNGHLLILTQGASIPAEVTIDILTSSPNLKLDLGNVVHPSTPFLVSAVVKQGGVPATGAKVVAVLENVNDPSDRIETQLLDSGSSNPDVHGNDGIYSEVILPPKDGLYTIAVSISNDGSVVPTATGSSGASRLLPPSQEFPAPAPTVQLPAGISKTARLATPLEVSGTANYKQYIQRVRDLKVYVNDPSNPANYTFDFTLPRTLVLDSQTKAPLEYRFYVSRDRDLLINLDVDALPAGVNEAFVEKLQEGSQQAGVPYAIPQFQYRDVYQYFAVASFDGVSHSIISNIVGLDEAQAPLTTTTPTTTTPTTTEKPADDSTTPEDDDTTPEDGSSTPEGDKSTPTTPDDKDTTSEGPGKNSTTNPPSSEDSKPFFKSAGGIVTIVVIVLVVLGAAGGGYWYFMKKRGSSGSRTSLV